MKKVLIILASIFVLTGCSKASRVNHNIRKMPTTLKLQEKSLLLIQEQMILYLPLRERFPLIVMKIEI